MFGDIDLVESRFDELGFTYKRLSSREQSNSIVQEWKEKFCSVESGGNLGIKSGSDFDFELVHVDYSTNGAIREFEQIRLECSEFFIRLQYSKNGNCIWHCKGIIPNTNELKNATCNVDTFLFPSDFLWNYTLTHESGFVNDPLFTRG